MTDISLLPGWSMAAASMEPLRQALLERAGQARVQAYDLPALRLSSIEADLAALAEQLAPGVLVGWSLGGMLAVQLMRRYPERFQAVVTLASNACFVARGDWQEAMAGDTFKGFYADYRDHPQQTLKRFALLVTQGSQQGRQLSRQLAWDIAGHEQRLHALAVLGVLDNRATLSRGTRPVLHCLAAQDALVPVAAAEALSALDTASEVRVHPQASHALPLEQPLWLAEQITDFLRGRACQGF